MFVLLLFSGFGSACAELPKPMAEKRNNIRYAFEHELIDIYDVPFEKYVELEMWDELEFILEANNKNVYKYRFPNLYYSRPHIINDEVWVFENTTISSGGIYVFSTGALTLLRKLDNHKFQKFEGGIRKVFNHLVISGGSDENVDVAVVWDTQSDDIETLALPAGDHYISSIEVAGNIIFVGSCGGKINAWNYDNLEYIGNFSTSERQTDNWEVFHEKECIQHIAVHQENLIGVGENTIFIWRLEDQELLESYEKEMSDSNILFYDRFMVEFKGNDIIVNDLDTNRVVNKTQTEKPVEDLIVTAEKVLPGFDGEVLIVTLRHNKGMIFYDFETFEILSKVNVAGETLNAYDKSVYATDDRNLYRYYLADKSPEKYQRFVQNIQTGQVPLDEEKYYRLMDILKDYPDFIRRSGISKLFMEMKKIKIDQTFRYGKIGERFVPENWGYPAEASSPATDNGYKEDVYGYKSVYEVINQSDNYYFVTLVFSWNSVYGDDYAYDKQTGEKNLTVNSDLSIRKRSFLIGPNDKSFKDQLEVGEKEPKNLVVYPEKVETVSKEYYTECIKALSPKNENIALIDKYLKDSLVKEWHPILEKRKKEIMEKKRGGSWFQRLFD